MMIGNPIGYQRQDQRFWMAAGFGDLLGQILGIIGIGIERQMMSMLLNRPYRQNGDINTLEIGFCLWPGQL